jgi:hypothetical protein
MLTTMTEENWTIELRCTWIKPTDPLNKMR